MFRLNFLTVSLCLCMNRPYQFYHFVPLVSFWFLVIYFLAWLPPRIYSGSLAEYGPRALLYLALKLLGLVSMITILYMSEVLIHSLRNIRNSFCDKNTLHLIDDRFSLKKCLLRDLGKHCLLQPMTTYANGGHVGGWTDTALRGESLSVRVS